VSDKTLHVPGLSEDKTVTLNLLAKKLKDRSNRNKLRSDYYDGKRAIRQVSSVIPPQYYRLAMALGWAAKGVDGLARRCNLDGMTWAGGDLDSLGFQELADENFLYSEFASGRTDSLIHGVSYLITTQGDDGEPRALVHAKDALNATGEWNARRRSLDNLLSVTSRERDEITGFVLYLDGETISAEQDAGVWRITDRSEHPWHVPVDPLVYRPRSSKRMGRSRITRPLMGFQDAALRALVRLEGHMDIYSIPQLIILGAPESIFKNADGSLKPSWKVALGRAFGIPDDDDPTAAQPRADVKQFNAQSPEPHLANLNTLAKLAARETDLSDADFALTDLANPTAADSYSEARENLIAEAEGATDDWSVPIRKTVMRALAIQNGLNEIPSDWKSIDTKWRPPAFVSKSAQADAGAKQVAAVPWLAETRIGLELIGLTEKQIVEALSEKQAAERRIAGRAVVAAVTGTNANSG